VAGGVAAFAAGSEVLAAWLLLWRHLGSADRWVLGASSHLPAACTALRAARSTARLQMHRALVPAVPLCTAHTSPQQPATTMKHRLAAPLPPGVALQADKVHSDGKAAWIAACFGKLPQLQCAASVSSGTAAVCAPRRLVRVQQAACQTVPS
jgi:hypothetical protein